MIAVASDKHRPGYNLFRFFLRMYGINAQKRSEMSCKLKFFIYPILFIIHVEFTFFILITFFSRNRVTDFATMKTMFTRKFKEISSIVMWYSLYRKRQKIAGILEEIYLLARETNTAAPLKILRSCIALIALTCFLPVVYFISCMDSNCFMKRYTTLEGYNNLGKFADFTFFVSFTNFTYMIQIFPCCVCSFYVCLCYFLCLILKRILHQANSYTYEIFSLLHIKKLVSVYQKIQNLLFMVNEIFSGVVFILTASIFVSMFFGSYILFKRRDTSDAFIIGSIVLAFINYLMLFYVTTMVHETDKRIKSTLKKFIRIITPQGDKICLEYLYLEAEESAFAFSAGGFFNFTKQTFFAAFGHILTYFLLLANL